MHWLQGFGVWTLLAFLPNCCSSFPVSADSGASSPKKGIIANNFQHFSFPAMAETLRSDAKKIRATLDRMADGFEILETRWSRQNDDPNDTFASNTLRNITNHPSAKILSEKLERISRTQNRNSRLINLQMESLTNLEESFDRLEGLLRQPTVSNDASNDETFSLYQRQVVDRLTSIDDKLDKLPTEGSREVSTSWSDVDGQNNAGKDRWNGTSSAGNTSFEDRFKDSSSPNYTNTVKIAVPSCEPLKGTGLRSGVYVVDPSTESIWGNTSAILCDTTTDGGGWTVIQKRGPARGEPINFTRSWDDYADGFGNLLDEFWLGNEIVHRMTFHYGPHELRVELEDWEGEKAWAQYSNFELGPRNDNYRIKIGGYTGNATDSFSAHDSTLFSTFDRRNDQAPRCCPCTSDYGGGWWYYSCFEANLNGDYYKKDQYRQPFRGIIWEHWRGNYSLKSTMMMIRSRSSNMKNQMHRNDR